MDTLFLTSYKVNIVLTWIWANDRYTISEVVYLARKYSYAISRFQVIARSNSNCVMENVGWRVFRCHLFRIPFFLILNYYGMTSQGLGRGESWMQNNALSISLEKSGKKKVKKYQSVKTKALRLYWRTSIKKRGLKNISLINPWMHEIKTERDKKSIT